MKPPKNVRHLSRKKTQNFGIGMSSEEFAFLDKTLALNQICRINVFFNLFTNYYNCQCHFQKKINKNEFKKDFFVSSKKP